MAKRHGLCLEIYLNAIEPWNNVIAVGVTYEHGGSCEECIFLLYVARISSQESASTAFCPDTSCVVHTGSIAGTRRLVLSAIPSDSTDPTG